MNSTSLFLKLRSPWVITLMVVILIQVLGLFLGPRDIGLLRVGEKPYYSTTLGSIIFDGGSAEYWGPGYTIFYHFSGHQHADIGVTHAEIWYWTPILNFPEPRSYFIDQAQISEMRKARGQPSQ